MSTVLVSTLLTLLWLASVPNDRDEPAGRLPTVLILRPSPAEDTLVNYCKLVRASYFYGQKLGDKERGLTSGDVEFFNDLWKEVFNIPAYQAGITPREFTDVARFRVDNREPFPPSTTYHAENPDPYLLFHIAKEVGMIHSVAFSRCPSCVEQSIARINILLSNTELHRQVSQMWLGTSTLKRISSSQEITDFWVFLRCMFIDDRINPKQKPYFINLPPVVRCPDTTKIQCKDEIKPKVSVGYRHCEIGGRIDTIGPHLVRGIENCPGAIYHIKFIARDQCNKKDSCTQVFLIENEKPTFTCPDDTVVTCIEDLVIRRAGVAASCNLYTKQTTRGPVLRKGLHNCSDAEYELEYIVEDSCGRLTNCIQKIRINNGPPTIQCPPDETVECKKDIKIGKSAYATSCGLKAKLTTTGPTLVKGKDNCPGAVYEVTYEVRDTCDRMARCVQKFTIDNKGPEITCPPNKEVLCFDDISTGPPAALKVSCNLGYDLKISDPVLIIGVHNCTGAVYSVTYTVTDDCGRTDECEQLFTILQPDLLITCPPDHTVMCENEIAEEKPTVSIACKLDYTITATEPAVIRGQPNCPGAVYVIIYEVADKCGRVKECRQHFTIDNPDPEIVCPPEITVNCYDELDPDNMQLPVPVVSCDLTYDLSGGDFRLVSGTDQCDGARYVLDVVVTDECNRKAECQWYFTLRVPEPEITCPLDRNVECEDQIQAENPIVKTYCEQTYQITSSAPVLIRGTRNCDDAVYEIRYTITDDCNRTFNCQQRFTIDNRHPDITCPPDKTVHCEADITEDSVQVLSSCGLNGRLEVTGPVLVSGGANCPGSRYSIEYTFTDECGRVSACEQFFTLTSGPLRVICPADTVVRSVADIRAGNVQVYTECGIDYVLMTRGPTLVSGVHGQVGAVYEIVYHVTDDCARTESCSRKYHFIGIPDDGASTICDCLREYKLVSLDLIQNPNDRLNRDLAALLKKYGCDKLKEWIQGNLTELWNAWSLEAVSQPGILGDISRRGNIDAVMNNLSKIDKAIEVLEEAINGDPKKTLEIAGEWGLTEALTHLTGSGTPAQVFAAIKSLGDFAKYMNNEILIINIRTLANYADQDPNIFDPDHYLREYAKIREIKPGDRVSWSDVHNPFRIAIYEYAQHRMNNVSLPALSEVWNSQQNMNLLRTVTYTMLKEVCQFWCYKLTLKHELNKLIREQSVLQRFKAILSYLNNYDCGGTEKPCTMDNAEFVEVNGKFVCRCISGYKWDPGNIRCIPFSDCSGVSNSTEIYRGDRYECECNSGYEWNANRTGCVPVKPDCPSIYPNSEALWDAATNQYLCYCISGYEWNAARTACVPSKPDCASYYPNSEAVWDAATNQYLCNCISGYEWNSARTECVLIKPDCPSLYPNSEALWDAATNQYLCYCISGYEWNAARTACVPSKPDCASYYPNSEAVWDAATSQYLCNCISGYEWNSARTECVLIKPDCPSIYPNSEALWDAATNQYLCYCISGYEWNAARTACVPSKPDCASYYPYSEAVWDAATNQYLCNCISGYEWNASRTECVVAKPDCPSIYSNSEALWDAATNQYLCYCISGFEWNAARTACVPSKPDCASYYPNSEAVWDAATSQYLCNCISGYEWNTSRTECVLAKPDCPSIYANSEALWDAATNQYLCYCISGYEWNASRTACVTSKPDCASYYPNSEAVWDAATNQYLCNCIAGYQWNATRTGCVGAVDCNTSYPGSVAVWDYASNQYLCNCPQGYVWNASRTQCIPYGAPDCVTYYARSYPFWDQATNQYLCYCLTGYEWNATRTECVPLGTGNREDPVVNPQQQKTGQCNISYGSGANEPEQYTIDVYQTTGTLQFTFDTYTVKDRIHIYHGGAKVFDSGCVGTSGSQALTLNGSSSVFRIVIDPLCDPNESDTQWRFTLGCPQ